MKDFFEGDIRTHRERMLAGDLYISDDPELIARAARAARLADLYHRQTVSGDSAARGWLEDLIGDLGDGVVIRPPLRVDYGDRISIGPRTFVNFNLTALDVARITIGCDCQIGPNVQLLTPTHPVDPAMRHKLESAQPIVIGDNVWIGGGAIVCPGVKIGENSVIGAGAVVVRDVPANVVAAGNPARVIRHIESDDAS
ncbi:sugar O-acetyltransferase [Microbacterium sp.]|uniref:sugar O-acetyltransferase n=1 Tax=Microbacterium sp. TaxID=51671 RepID=UPI00356B5ECE